MVFASCFTSLAMASGEHVFYGNVIINGQPAPDGIPVEIRVNGLAIATESTYNGTYGYPVGSFYVEDSNGSMAGKSMELFVNSTYSGQSLAFCNDCKANLNLIVNGAASGSTGMFLGMSAVDWMMGIVVGIVVAVVIIAARASKKSSKKD
jgi:hypothetical protein